MDGAHCFTICGDPLYFAPEIVLQQGYDYSADLWAFGIIIYELFEGNTPFGTIETDETSIFKAISKYRPSKLSFTSNKTPENARALLMDILQFSSDTRAGYQHEEHILDAEFFLGNSFHYVIPEFYFTLIFLIQELIGTIYKTIRAIPLISSQLLTWQVASI